MPAGAGWLRERRNWQSARWRASLAASPRTSSWPPDRRLAPVVMRFAKTRRTALCGRGISGRTAPARWFLDAPAATPRNPSIAAVQGARDGRRWFFDGWEALRSQLMSAGLSRDQIFIAEMCTASHPTPSAPFRRASCPPAGRMAGAIGSARPHP